MGIYTSPERVVRDGRLVAFEGERMTEAEAMKRGLSVKSDEPEPKQQPRKRAARK